MKYPAATNGTDNTLRYYGHILYSGQCLTRTKVDDGHEFFTLSPCRYTDSAAQEAQYFQLKQVTWNPNGEEVIWNATLPGHPQGGSGDTFSFTPGTDAAPAITVARNKPSGYQLTMQYVHIN